MREIEGDEKPVIGSIVIEVEAAPQGMLRCTLESDTRAPRWLTLVVAHDDAVLGTARLPEQAAHLLVRGGIASIGRSIPSLRVGGVRMRPEAGPDGNAQIRASGEAIFLRSEWEAAVRDIDGTPAT